MKRIGKERKKLVVKATESKGRKLYKNITRISRNTREIAEGNAKRTIKV